MNRSGGVGINASIIGEGPTGLGLYAINLIRALDTLRDDLRVYTSSPESLGPLRARMLPGHAAGASRAWDARTFHAVDLGADHAPG